MEKSNEITLIIAKKGAGKTTIAAALAYSQPKKVFWVTPIEGSYPFKKVDCKGFGKINFKNKNQYVFYVTQNKEDLEDFFRKLFNILKNNEDGAMLVIDELDYYHNSRTSNNTGIYKAINYGRHLNLDLILIARRVQDTPTIIATNCDYFVLGKNSNINNDTKYYEQFIKSDIISMSRRLEIGKFLKVDTLTMKVSTVSINEEARNKLFKE